MESRELKDKASAFFTKGRFAKAAETYEEFCALDKRDHQARLRCGDAWSKAGKKDKAVIAYSLAAEGYAKDGFLPRAIAASKLVLEIDPAHKGVQKMLAELYAQKSGGARSAGKAAAVAAPAPEMEITRSVSAPVNSSFANNKAAIDIDAPIVKAKPTGYKPAPVEAPSPLNRSDALELPEYVIPMGDGASSKGGMSAQAGPSPNARKDGIEIDVTAGPESGPRDLVETSIDIELTGGQPVTGEVEIPIEGQPLPDADQLPPELQRATEPLAPAVTFDLGLPPPPPGPQAASFELDVEVAAPRPPAPPPPPRASGVYDLTEELPEPKPSAPVFDLSEEVEAPPEPVRSFIPSEVEGRTPPPPPEPLDPPFSPPVAKAVAPPARTSALPPSVSEAAAPPSIKPIESVQPPGLKPRRSEPAAPPPGVPVSSPSSSRIWLPPTFTPAVTPAAPVRTASAEVRPPASSPVPAATEASTDLERSLQAFMQFDPDAPAPKTAPVEPAPRPHVSFTELDLDEGDSLLHAVEAASNVPKPTEIIEEAMEAPEDPRNVEPGGLPKIPLFSDLPEDAFIALFEKCPLQRFEEGQLVFEQGDKADAFYVICGGQVRVFRTDGELRKELATLEEGSFFGEMALLSEAPRSASVEAAAEDTQVLVISAEILKELSGTYPVVSTALKKFCRQRMLSNLMNQAAIFSPFNRNDRRDLVQKFRARDVNKGDVLVKEGTSSDGLYVVLSGEVEIEAKGHRIATLKEGQVFGEMSLLMRSPASATVRALRHTSLLRLPKPDFDSLILSHPQVLEHVASLIDERQKSDRSRQRNDTAEIV